MAVAPPSQAASLIATAEQQPTLGLAELASRSCLTPRGRPDVLWAPLSVTEKTREGCIFVCLYPHGARNSTRSGQTPVNVCHSDVLSGLTRAILLSFCIAFAYLRGNLGFGKPGLCLENAPWCVSNERFRMKMKLTT